MPPSDPVDIIATQILFDAKSALANLKNFNESVTDSGKKIAVLKNIIAAVSKQIGGDLKTAEAAVRRFANAFSGINPELIKGIGKELQLLDNIAKKSLGDIGGKSLESSARVAILSNAIQQMAIKGKTSIDQVVRSLQMLNASSGKAYQFGKLGFSQDDIVKAGEAAKQGQIQLQSEFKKTGSAAEAAGKKAEGAFGKVFNSVNAMRIALGALISMLLFQGIQAVSQFVRESLDQFTELEESLFRIRAAEKVLSEAGVEVSVSGLKKGISDLREELKIFSDEELTKLVGQLSVLTKELGFNEEQILALAKAVAIKNKISIDDESLSQTASKIVTTMLTDQSKGAASLGISLNEAAIEAKALDLGLLAAGESAKDLTDKEKKFVKLQLVLESAAGDAEMFGEFLDTNAAKIDQNTAAWEDFQASVGGLIATVIPAFTTLFKIMTGAADMFKALVPVFKTIAASAQLLEIALTAPGNKIEHIKQSLLEIPNIFKQIAADTIPQLFAKMPDNAPQWFKDLYGEFLVDTETATEEVEELLTLDDDETAKALEEIDDKIRDIAIDAQHAKEDLAVLLGQKQEDLEIEFTQKRADIDTEYVRKEQDAARELARDIEDINKDAERERQKVLEKGREEERKAEEDHQLKLWELKMRYLMDLEDALHARDARQIIRLQRQYELDKELLEKKKQQEDEERANSLESELEDVELKRQERLEDAQIEYEQKLADLATAKARELEELNIWKAREEADLKLWYERELQDIDRQTQQKIEKLLAGYIEEQKIHEEQQEAIHQILLKYFGKNTALVDDLMTYTNAAFSNMAALAGAIGGFSPSHAPASSNSNLSQQGLDQYHNSERGFRHGGTLIATQPTTATFGEVPEAVTFTPLGRRGRDVGKIFASGNGSGGEGRIALDITLSPDLRAQIVEDSMDGVASVIARVNGSKV